ncbi:nucleotidyltransferase family protein [Prochlorococcus marinus]|uniref:nucleotidyltransferase family protein n=1 Tax=Prochlorococcus marinus TaxID=1219 RepID=UPI0039AFA827
MSFGFINYDHLLMKETITLDQCIRIIESSIHKIGLVVDTDRKLLGTVTDGDIRRALLLGGNLKTSVKQVMNANYRFVYESFSSSVVDKMLNEEKLKYIPVVNEHLNLLRLLTNENGYVHEFKNPIVIMAGGKGKRLRPYTESCPKPMLTVKGIPILERLIIKFRKSGFSKFYISVNYLKDQIMEYFKDGKKYGVEINYLIERKSLGTAGSLSLLPNDISLPFIVINGDILTDLEPSNLLLYHHEKKAKITIAAREYSHTVPYGVLQTKGSYLDQIIEKPNFNYLISAGIYVIEPSAIRSLNSNEYLDMPDFFDSINDEGSPIAICPLHEDWLDIGRVEDYTSVK